MKPTLCFTLLIFLCGISLAGTEQFPSSNFQISYVNANVTHGQQTTIAKQMNASSSSSFVASTTFTAASCSMTYDGACEATVTGGNPPYYYSWSNGATTQSIDSLQAGIYELTVFDNGNPQLGDTFPILYPFTGNITGNGSIAFYWNDIQLLGPAVEIGDVVYVSYVTSGLEYYAGKCTYTGPVPGYSSIIIHGDDNVTPNQKEGLAPGDQILFKLWSQRYNQIIPLTASYTPNSILQGTFIYAAVGIISSMTGVLLPSSSNVQVITTNLLAISDLSVATMLNNATIPSGNNGSIQLTVTGGAVPYSYFWSNATTSSEINNLQNGLYIVTITDASGCSETFSYEILLEGAGSLTTQLIATDLSCYGSTIGSMSVLTSGGIPPYYYRWSDGSSTSAIDSLAAGHYAVTIFDAGISQPGNPLPWNFTTSNNSQVVKVPVQSLFLNGQPFSGTGSLGAFYHLNNQFECAGFSAISGDTLIFTMYGDDSATPQKDGFYEGESIVWQLNTTAGSVLANGFSASSGNMPLFYHSNALSVLSFVVSPAGNANFESGAIAAPPMIQVWNDTHHEYSPPGNNGEIFQIVSGGTPPYTIEWADGSTSENRTNLSAGIYEVTIGDSNGCYYHADYTVNLVTLTPVTASHTISDCLCYSSCDGSIDISPAGGITPYHYIWSNGATTQDINNLCPGTYTVTVADFLTGQMTMPFSFVNTGQSHILYFNVSSVNIMGLAVSSGDYLGVFYERNGSLVCGGYRAMNTTGSMTIAAWGDDPFSAVKDGFATGEAFTFKYWKASTGTLIDLTATYNPGSLSGGTYIYNGITQIIILTGTYFTPANPPLIQDFTVSHPDSITIVPSIQNSIGLVGNGTISLSVTGNPPFSYNWSNGGTDSLITGLSQGNYWVTVTDKNGCWKVQSFFVSFSTPAIPLILSSSVNAPACNDSTGSIAISLSGGFAPYYYQWNTGNTSANLDSIPAGTYTVTVGSSLNNPFPFSWTYTPTSNYVSLFFSVNVNSQQPAEGDVVGAFYSNSYPNWECAGYGIVTADGTIPDFKVYEDDPLTPQKDGFVEGDYMFFRIFRYGSGLTYPFFDYTVTQSVGITLPYYSTGGGTSCSGVFNATLTDAASYPLKIIKTFTLESPPLLSLSEVVTEIDPAIGNNGAIDLAVTGGVPPYQCLWSNGAQGLSVSGLSYGTYGYTLTDVLGCSVSSSVLVDFSGLYLFFDVDTTMVSCYGSSDGSINLTNVTAIPPVSCAWSTGSTDMQINNLAAGNYTLTITTGSGDVASYDFTIIEPQVLELGVQSADIHPINNLYGCIQNNPSGGTPPYTYLWNNGSTQQNLEGLTVGDYTCEVIDSQGCTSTVTVNISYLMTPNWPYQVTSLVHELEIPAGISMTCNGGASDYGDFIGVFYDSSGTLACAGYTMWTGNSTRIHLYGNNLLGGIKNGFDIGELIQYKYFDISEMEAIEVTPLYDYSYPNDAFFKNNGLSALLSLEDVFIGNAPAVANDNPFGITAFPNPANDFVMIKGLKSGDTYQLHNVLGDCISSQAAVGEMECISLEGLSSGVYYIRIKSGGQTTILRVCKSDR